jgi:transcriptional regulator
MYLPRAFAETDLVALDALAAAYPFATLITLDDDGAPFVSHLPILYSRDGDRVELRGHWSRANPQWRHTGKATLIFQGPSAYVSPGWYPDKEAEARVPTWNYAIAHLAGALDVTFEHADLAAIVDDLSRRFEAGVQANDPAHVPWRYENDRDDHRVQLHGIVGFRMQPSDITLKFKLNQNHPAANVAAVADHLERGDDQQRSVAALMRARLANRTETTR